MVSPAKGIWKDFSSEKGNSVALMEHEHFTYPEADSLFS
jgi:DNA primase